jgi:hypothetical protein
MSRSYSHVLYHVTAKAVVHHLALQYTMQSHMSLLQLHFYMILLYSKWSYLIQKITTCFWVLLLLWFDLIKTTWKLRKIQKERNTTQLKKYFCATMKIAGENESHFLKLLFVTFSQCVKKTEITFQPFKPPTNDGCLKKHVYCGSTLHTENNIGQSKKLACQICYA